MYIIHVHAITVHVHVHVYLTVKHKTGLSVILIIQIIPEDILFKHATANNVQYGDDRTPF